MKIDETQVTFDGVRIVNGRVPSEERQNRELFFKNFNQLIGQVKPPPKRGGGLISLAQHLKAQGSVIEKARSLAKANPRPRPKTGQKVLCAACQGCGFVRRNLAPNHPDFGKSIICRKCRDPWMEYQRRIESYWPVPKNTHDLASKPLDERHSKLVELGDLLERVIEIWPKGVIIVLDGQYGTAKTHALSIIYRQAWKQKRGAAYLPSAQALQEVFTLFQSQEHEAKASLENALALGDAISGNEIAKQQKNIRISRRRLSSELLRVPWLLVDEAQRYSRKGGNGWVEQHLASLIDKKIANQTSVVLAGNGLGDGRFGPAGPIQNQLHPSILDRVTSQDCVWLDLNGVPSGRPHYGRNAGGWWKSKNL